MKIEVNKSQGFKTSIIGLFETDQKAIEDFKAIAGKWASELMAESIESAIKCKKYLPKDAIEISVSVSIGEPIKDEKE